MYPAETAISKTKIMKLFILLKMICLQSVPKEGVQEGIIIQSWYPRESSYLKTLLLSKCWNVTLLIKSVPWADLISWTVSIWIEELS